jgi:hypothetical protein
MTAADMATLLFQRLPEWIGEQLARHRSFDRLSKEAIKLGRQLSEDIVDLSLGDCFVQDPYDSSRMKDRFRQVLPLALTHSSIELIQGEAFPRASEPIEQICSNRWWQLRGEVFWLTPSETFPECLQCGTCGELSVSTRSQACIVLYPSDEFVVFHTLLLSLKSRFKGICISLEQNPGMLQ